MRVRALALGLMALGAGLPAAPALAAGAHAAASAQRAADHRITGQSRCAMSIALIVSPADPAASPSAAWNWNPQVLASSDQLLRAVADGQAMADPQQPVPVHLEVTTLNRVTGKPAATQARSETARNRAILAVEPICTDVSSDEPLPDRLASDGRWSPPAWWDEGRGVDADAGLSGTPRPWAVGDGGALQPARFDRPRTAVEAGDGPDQSADASPPATLVGLNTEAAPDDPAEPPRFAGAVFGGFGPAFSGLPDVSGLEDVQPLRLTPRGEALAPDPSTAPLAPVDPGSLAAVAAGAAPEPAAWAMMLIGFAALGGLLRRAKAPGAGLRRTGEASRRGGLLARRLDHMGADVAGGDLA